MGSSSGDAKKGIGVELAQILFMHTVYGGVPFPTSIPHVFELCGRDLGFGRIRDGRQLELLIQVWPVLLVRSSNSGKSMTK